MDDDAVIHDVRIRRQDKFCFVVQKLVERDEYTGGGRGKGKGVATGKTKLVWEDVGYYSHVEGAAHRHYALKQACIGCIDDGANGDSAKELLESVRRLEKRLPKLIAECDLPAHVVKEEVKP